MGTRCDAIGVNAETAPATVSGESAPNKPLTISIEILGKVGKDVRAASQETCHHKLPIFRAWGAAGRNPVAAADVSTGGEPRQVMQVVALSG